MRVTFRFCTLLTIVTCPLMPPTLGQAAEIDFQSQIQPILERACLECHGSVKQSNGFRLDSREAFLEGGVSGPMVLPGESELSELVDRLTGDAVGSRMPLEKEPLTPQEVALIRAWIDQGVPWSDETEMNLPSSRHWSYQPVRRPPLPEVEDADWRENTIDSFSLASLEKKGLQPAPRASREALIRRVTLDLTGLPPSLDEIDAFLADESAEAYAKVVERLLGSPHYGERWARQWLDLARYADTNGYEKDRTRSIWLYRDWVIRALNEDMPFDQFTIEQLAGDLLPDPRQDLLIATGFHRNTMVNEEGGTDAEEYRVAAVYDRTNTTASVWLGTTLECAQCHDHKYDPFSMEDYYRFFAFFNNARGDVKVPSGESFGTNLNIPPPPYLASHRRDLEEQILKIDRWIASRPQEVVQAQPKWEEQVLPELVTWETLEPVSLFSIGGSELAALEDGSVLASGPRPPVDTYILEFEADLSGVAAIRLQTLRHGSLPFGKSGRSDSGHFVLTGFEVDVPSESSDAPLDLKRAAANFWTPGFHPAQALFEDRTGWSVMREPTDFGLGRQVVFSLQKPLETVGSNRFRVRLRQDSELEGHLLGRFRLSVSRDSKADAAVSIPDEIARILQTRPRKRQPSERKLLSDFYLTQAPSLRPARERRDFLHQSWIELKNPGTMVMEELDENRQTFVHQGGSFRSPGKSVKPGVPTIFQGLPENAFRNRLGLARWLVSRENPLTARVMVNRIWMEHFGQPLVETVEDFGTRGSRPTHPQLLDWLAAEFMDGGWQLKRLHRLIVASATFRQSSHVTAEKLEQDPHNRLLSRGPRFRMDAEMIRDSSLSLGGLLSSKMFGPSTFPDQPEGTWNLIYNTEKWMLSEGQDRYRRGLYTFWRRTAPYPSFTVFDATSRETACLRRVRTNTPLQALTTLNDPTFFASARGLANRILTQPTESASVADRVRFAFRLSLAREPTPKEQERLILLYQEQKAIYQGNPSLARTVSREGNIQAAPGLDEIEFAAWAIVANVLLNLDEVLTRG